MRNLFPMFLRAVAGAMLVAAALQPVGAGGLASRPRAGGNEDHDRSYSMKEQETIRKSFEIPGGAHASLDIDNIFGSIEVTGEPSRQIEIEVSKTIRAESATALDRARKEVSLDMDQGQGAVKLYVNGPFRCHCDDCRGSHDGRGYVVRMDFKVRVPREIDLEVRTVNEGGVHIRDVSGKYLVRNVNGGIEMESVAGSGSARTVNGPVTVSFRQNPVEESDFRTVNGAVELRFAPGLSADFRLKNMNGGIYTDYAVTALPVREVAPEHRGAKLILRADRTMGVRVGAGGPEIEVENLNGEIRILQSHE